MTHSAPFQAHRDQVLLNRFHLTHPLGQGGMGEVWMASHRMLARPAAVKLIKPKVLSGMLPAEIEKLTRSLQESKLELGSRGVRIESLEKDLENELRQSEAARARAVQVSKELDEERKASQRKTIEEQYSKRSQGMELQSSVKDLTLQLKQAEERANAAEASRDNIVDRMRADGAEWRLAGLAPGSYYLAWRSGEVSSSRPLSMVSNAVISFCVLATARRETRLSQALVEAERANLEVILARLSTGVLALENDLSIFFNVIFFSSETMQSMTSHGAVQAVEGSSDSRPSFITGSVQCRITWPCALVLLLSAR